jgi:hypothetical protein
MRSQVDKHVANKYGANSPVILVLISEHLLVQQRLMQTYCISLIHKTKPSKCSKGGAQSSRSSVFHMNMENRNQIKRQQKNLRNLSLDSLGASESVVSL